MKVLGLLFMRNESYYIQRCLEHLELHDIPVHVIDNESTDNSADIARSFLGRNVVTVETLPYSGHYSLARLLTRLQEIANHSNSDWFVRCDADEIIEPPARFDTLREGLEDADARGFNAINFDEFVFLPTEEDTGGYEGTDFVARMRYYYFFQPRPNRLQRAWKKPPGGVDIVSSGGHAARFADKRIYPEPFVLRHYMVLSRKHALSKYGGRVYDVQAHINAGWHSNRIHFTPDKLSFPCRADMKCLDAHPGWDRSDPKDAHEFLGRLDDRKSARMQFEPPAVHTTSEPPAPFIVGAGRSGTTLLRMMLDAHPDLAIPPETHVLPRLAALHGTKRQLRKRFLATLTRAPTWPDLQLHESEVASGLRRLKPFDKARATRLLYRLYANRHGKRRWGDKTPRYSLHMLTIARLLPEAHFIHLIRDGRDVAMSGRGLWFGPASDMASQASNWTWTIRECRQQAQNLQHRYLEVHYEDLVRHPERMLRTICAFINLPYHSSMLRYFETASQRLSELAERRDAAGVLVASGKMRQRIHSLVTTEPDTSRIGYWRTEMSKQEQIEFEDIAGNMLRELGYGSHC